MQKGRGKGILTGTACVRRWSLPVVWLVLGSLLLVLSQAYTYPVNAATYTAGDLAPRGSPDGVLNSADLLILQQFVLGTQTPTGDEALIVDVAPFLVPDGVLNAGDVVVLIRAIMGQITLPPIVVGPDAPLLAGVASPTSNNPQTITGTAAPNVEVLLYVNGVQQNTTVILVTVIS